MKITPSHHSTKIFSLIVFVLCLLGIYIGWDLSTPFHYEPLGPRPFPLGSLALIALCCVLLFFWGDKTEVFWGDKTLLKNNCILALAFFGLVLSFEEIGFILSTAVFSFVCSLLFGARFKQAALYSILQSCFLFYAFERWLDVTLPIGYIFTQN